MGKKKKSFIDKKDPQTHTFSLVHRSQRDPLAADETAPQLILAAVQTQQEIKLEKDGRLEGRDDSEFVDASDAKVRDEKFKKFSKKDDLVQLGVFYDDDYDYQQHLKQSGQEGAERIVADSDAVAAVAKEKGLDLPADLFASPYEEDVGLLNRAAPVSGPRLDWDPEVAAALDDDLDFEDPDNIMDDDFVIQAESDMVPEVGDDADGAYSDDGGWNSDEDLRDIVARANTSGFGLSNAPDFAGRLNPKHNPDTETIKSRFTEYSMSSSILPRSEVLQTHDERFEKLFEQYDDDQIGALDEHEDEAGGNADIALFMGVLDEYIEEKEGEFDDTMTIQPKSKLNPAGVRSNNQHNQQALPGIGEEDDDSDGSIVIPEYQDKTYSKDWDCESILSTRSTLYNHPTRIIEVSKKPPKLDPETGLPVATKSRKENTHAEAESESEDEDEEPMNLGTRRNKAESAADKKQRKQAIKDERRARRMAKKSTNVAFKDEEIRQKAAIMSNNRHGLKIKQITS